MMVWMMCNEARKRYHADEVKTVGVVYVSCGVGSESSKLHGSDKLGSGEFLFNTCLVSILKLKKI